MRNEYQTPQPREPCAMRKVTSGPLDVPRSVYTEPLYQTNHRYLTTTPSAPMGMYSQQQQQQQQTPPTDSAYHYSSSGYDRQVTWDRTSTASPSTPHTSTPPSTRPLVVPPRHPSVGGHVTNSTVAPGGTGSLPKHDYVNVPNTASEARSHVTNALPLYTSATLPRAKRDSSETPVVVYENVELKPGSQTPKRYSDSQLDEAYMQFRSSSNNKPSPSSELRPTTLLGKEQGSNLPRPKSAEPSVKPIPPGAATFSRGGSKEEPSAEASGTADITDEEMYGWSLNTPSQPSTLTASTQSSLDEGPSTLSEGQSREGGKEGDEDSDSDDDMHDFSADISDDILDCSEVSDPDSNDTDAQIDDGMIKSYAPFPHDKFPFDWSWDDIKV